MEGGVKGAKGERGRKQKRGANKYRIINRKVSKCTNEINSHTDDRNEIMERIQKIQQCSLGFNMCSVGR